MRTTRLNSPNLFDTVRAEGSTARQNLRNVWFGKKKKSLISPPQIHSQWGDVKQDRRHKRELLFY